MKTNITKDQVLSVYSGIDGKCCCGCAGKHSYNSSYIEEAGKERGYPIEQDEVNDRMVNKVIRLINEASELTDDMSDMKTIVVGQRVYIAYLK